MTKQKNIALKSQKTPQGLHEKYHFIVVRTYDLYQESFLRAEVNILLEQEGFLVKISSIGYI